MINEIRPFLDEVKAEMKKVSWPTADQTKGATMAVIVAVLLTGTYFGVIDFFLSKFMNIFLG
jgi:preprotein translocase subunit SecE